MTAVAVEPAPPEPPFGAVGPPIDPDVYRRRWIILAVLCLSLLVVGIDGTIVVVALPSFVRELGASQSELQWITDAHDRVREPAAHRAASATSTGARAPSSSASSSSGSARSVPDSSTLRRR
jgi:hypothetical protein